MPTLTLRNIPDELYAELKKNAEINRRSINSEISYCLENSIQAYKRPSIEEIIAKARELRSSIKENDISLEEMITAKNEGRL